MPPDYLLKSPAIVSPVILFDFQRDVAWLASSQLAFEPPTDIKMTDPAIIAAAIALVEIRRLEVLDRDPTDMEVVGCDALTLKAYSTKPISENGKRDVARLAIEAEGALLDPAIRTLLVTIGECAHAMQ